MNTTIFVVDGVAESGFTALLETLATANALREISVAEFRATGPVW
ncbi:hypothetical protein [Nocardia jinanensis]|uniref:Uncharacterized protein n=1 Tax=Nocardia jinanensis TaxID=382504 RepID=A0A917RUN5_9NOCA|nr:hypothetical protein [Nocardia jinanensis]GGL32845.1 hypothetical protein GCM10011588_54640 [Nocardia jinanensis]